VSVQRCGQRSRFRGHGAFDSAHLRRTSKMCSDDIGCIQHKETANSNFAREDIGRHTKRPRMFHHSSALSGYVHQNVSVFHGRNQESNSALDADGNTLYDCDLHHMNVADFGAAKRPRISYRQPPDVGELGCVRLFHHQRALNIDMHADVPLCIGRDPSHNRRKVADGFTGSSNATVCTFAST
jgi:hypothetical protein